MFTQGINEVQTMSNLLESSQLQDQINHLSYPRLHAYATVFRSFMPVLGLDEVAAQHRDLDICQLDAQVKVSDAATDDKGQPNVCLTDSTHIPRFACELFCMRAV